VRNKEIARAERCIAFRHAEEAGAVRFFAGP
jgi:hypothetical protein